MTLHEFFKHYTPPTDTQYSLNKLKYNSLYIVAAQFKQDNMKKHFTFYIPDKNIIFHRVTKLNFLGETYSLPNGQSTVLFEITARPKDNYQDKLILIKQTLADAQSLGLANIDDVLDIDCQYSQYGYVIYDLNHRYHTDKVLSYLKSINVFCCGRFVEFEYYNSDQVVFNSRQLAKHCNIHITPETSLI